MDLNIHNTVGILLNSSVNLLNYNSGNPGEWYNHTFTRQLTHYEIFEPIDDPPPDLTLLVIIIVIVAVNIGAIAGIYLFLKYYEKETDVSTLKHNPKNKPQIKKRTYF